MHEFIAGNTQIPALREEISEVAGFLWERGWAERNAGNLSYNVTEAMQTLPEGFEFGEMIKTPVEYRHLAGRMILLTGTGTRMREIKKNMYENTCVVKINNDGNAYQLLKNPELDMQVEPTSELPSHLAIHNMLLGAGRPENAIIHTHPDHLIALTHIGEFCNEERINNMLWGMQPETRVFIMHGLGFIPYLMTGSQEIAQATVESLQKHQIVLWEKHGCLSIGENAYEAFDLIDIAEKSAAIFFKCKSAGYPAEGISPDNLEELMQAFRK